MDNFLYQVKTHCKDINGLIGCFLVYIEDGRQISKTYNSLTELFDSAEYKGNRDFVKLF